MYRVTKDALDINEVVSLVKDPAAGAVATFIGTARDHNVGRRVLSLEYEAYPEMAETELRKVGETAQKKVSRYL